MTESNRPQGKVLAIDDNPTNLALIKAHLQKMGLATYLAQGAAQGIELALTEKPDLILLDVMMPDIDGYEACKKLKANEQTAHIPIIFVSAKDQASDKVNGLKLGAIDYITKPFDPGELKARVGTILQMVGLQEQLRAQANTDELTGLLNRRRFLGLLDREVLRAKLHGGALCVVMLDIDHFKQINDTYGHLGGDVALKQLAELLAKNVRPLDMVARYGGEEFVIIMPNTPADKAMMGAERLRQMVEKTRWRFSADPVTLTISMGLAMLSSFGQGTGTELVLQADKALYAAKHQGRNRVIRWDENTEDKDQDDAKNAEPTARELKTKVFDLNRQVRRQVQATMAGLCKVLNAQNPEILKHSENVQGYALAIAETLGEKPEFIEKLSSAAQLHDMGKLLLPQNNNDDDQKHPEHNSDQYAIKGLEILQSFAVFRSEIQLIKGHLERMDGKGFPGGLAGKQIPFGSRILAVANTLDNLIQQDQLDCEHAIAKIRDQINTHFDPDVVDALETAWVKNAQNWPLNAHEPESLRAPQEEQLACTT